MAQGNPLPGEKYLHFKNKLYQVIAVAKHSETMEPYVVYQALYGDFGVYIRPYDMFVSEVDHEKYPEAEQQYRFKKVELGKDEIIKDPVKVTAENQPEEELKVAEEPKETEEADIEPLLKFLDAADLNDRLNVLVQYKDDITEMMIDSMGAAMDCVLNGKTLEEKYYELDKVIRTKLQYEKKPRI